MRLELPESAGAALRGGEQAARRGARTPLGDGLARAGYGARALLALTLAAIVLRIVTGAGGEADQRGAVEALTATGFGTVLVVLSAMAFAGHAAWRALEAVGGRTGGGGGDRRLEALADGAAAVAHAALCILCVAILAGRSTSSEDEHSQHAAATVFGLPLGRPLLGLLGAGLVAGAVGLVVWTARHGFEKRLRTEAMPRPVELVNRGLEYAGEGARALLLATAGVLVVRSALIADPQKTQGLDGTLRALARQPLGGALLAVVAAGLAAWGAGSILQAAYLRTGRR